MEQLHPEKRRRGQALIMVTLALVAMFGLIGLAVDFGWAFFLQKAAQSAADAAALAAAERVLELGSGLSDFSCSPAGVGNCAWPPVPCPAGGNLTVGCQYADRNGFRITAGGRQNVMIAAGDRNSAGTVCGGTPATCSPPTAPGVNVYYWVTVTVAEEVPQLFSAILGNGMGLVSARATAAVVDAVTLGSLILLNRENDLVSSQQTGLKSGHNLLGNGGGFIRVPGGIQMASACNACGPRNDTWAGELQGSTRVIDTPFTFIRTGGSYRLGGSASWTETPVNRPESDYFWDPMRHKGGQPPLNPAQSTLPLIPVWGGTLQASDCAAGGCLPGNYFAADPATCPTCRPVATGNPIIIGDDVTFASGAGSFGDFVFFGGLHIKSATVNFGPGRYVVAGAGATSGPNAGLTFAVDNGATLIGGTAENSDAGRILILTDSSYGGQLDATVLAIRGAGYDGTWFAAGNRLPWGDSSIKAGNNAQSLVQLFGLNPEALKTLAGGNNAGALYDLSAFAPGVVWQDQGNSFVDYSSDGRVSCGETALDCPNSDTTVKPKLEFWSGSTAVWGGFIYQPRGAFSVIHAVPSDRGALRIITGAIEVDAGSTLTLVSPSTPITTLKTSLVE